MDVLLSRPLLMQIHFLLMFIGTLFFLSGGFIARFLRSKKGWLKSHRILNIIGLITFLAGFGFMFAFYQDMGLGHFNSIHSILGGLTLIIISITPVIAQVAMKAKKPKLRILHKWLGRLSLLLVVGVVVLGFLKVFGVI